VPRSLGSVLVVLDASGWELVAAAVRALRGTSSHELPKGRMTAFLGVWLDCGGQNEY